MVTMKVLARIDVTPLLTLCDAVSGLQFQIVAPEFKDFDHSAMYCDSVEEVLALIQEIKIMRAQAATFKTVTTNEVDRKA